MMLVSLSITTLLAACSFALEPDVCFPCVDGSAWNASMTLPNGTSCSHLVMASSGIASTSDACLDLQVTAFLHCGCVVAPPQDPPSLGAVANASCTVCPDGSNVIEDIFIPLAEVTCGVAQSIALGADAEECPDFRVYAPWCQCPDVTPSCTLCPDGRSPLSRSYEIPGLDVTCEELEFIATTISDQQQCNEIATLSSICDCPPIPKPSCSLCNDGRPSLFPKSVLSNGLTCADVEEIASTITSDYDCDVIKTYAASECGCVEVFGEPPPCTAVCPDGSRVSYPNEVIDIVNGEEVTCGRLDEEVDLGLADEKRCQTYFYIGVNLCGCEAPVLDAPSCTLCENGMPPPRLFQRLDASGTCGDFAVLAETIGDSRQCTAIQATAGVACGCTNPISDGQACRLCDNNAQALPDTARLADPDAGISCSEAEYVGTMAPDALVCSGLQRNFGELCCAAAPMITTGLSPQTSSGLTSSTTAPLPRSMALLIVVATLL